MEQNIFIKEVTIALPVATFAGINCFQTVSYTTDCVEGKVEAFELVSHADRKVQHGYKYCVELFESGVPPGNNPISAI